MNFELPSIYPITDTRISGISHRDQVERLIAGGATVIQLRDKHAAPAEFFRAAKDALFVARKTGVKLLINDRVDIALALNADGVHVGHDDLSPEKARAILGDRAIIGFSTHTIEQAVEAIKMPVDYIAFGPVFKTKTKEAPDPTVGLGELIRVRKAIGDFPLVAIGGIDADNLLSVLRTGADSAAIISALVSDVLLIKENMSSLLASTNP
ncbi:MAG: thiamine phosphate synthase [Pyrinomonadaceae bacterium]